MAESEQPDENARNERASRLAQIAKTQLNSSSSQLCIDPYSADYPRDIYVMTRGSSIPVLAVRLDQHTIEVNLPEYGPLAEQLADAYKNAGEKGFSVRRYYDER